MSNHKIFKNSKDQHHREDGPAIIWESGDKEWLINGIRHREDGPALEHANGFKAWYLNGECHREDGPAIIWKDGHKSWFLNNVEYERKEFKVKMRRKKILNLKE